MFDKLKRMLGAGTRQDAQASLTPDSAQGASYLPVGNTAFGGLGDGSASGTAAGSGIDQRALDLWAKRVDSAVSTRAKGAPTVSGLLHGKRWRMEVGRSSRDYIRGDEIRMRAEIDVAEDAVLLLMTRQLKDKLEKAAYSVYTDPLQTTVDPNLPEEMRWLAMFEEFGWPEVGVAFFDEFALLCDSRSRAMDFLSTELASELLAANRLDAEGKQLPLVVMVMRGKAYLRTVHEPADLQTVVASHMLFSKVCARAIERLSTDLAL